MLDNSSKLRPPAPVPRARGVGPLGLLRVLTKNPLEAWTEVHFEQPVISGGLTFGRVVVVNEPAAIRRVLLDNHQNYEKDWLQRRVLSAGLTNGLLTAEAQQWRTQRRVLAPLFARKNVTNFASGMLEVADRMVNRLTEQGDRVVDLAVEVTRVTLEVMERTLFSDGFGRDPEEVRTNMKIYFETVGRIDAFDIFGLPDAVPRISRWKVRPALRFFEKAIDTVIAERRRLLTDRSKPAPQDILTLLLEAKEGLSESEVRANVLTFIAAGHETTANCLSWSLFLLSQSPEWRQRVHAEAVRELRDRDIGTLADRLVETRAVIDEANRLYPPIAAISRAALGPDVLSGRPIKAGTMVVIAPYVLHRHRSLWSEPDRFDPGRFLPEEREKIDRFSYLPFGVGPRTCIGSTFALQEAAIMLATITRHFEFTLIPNHRVWPVQKVTLRPGGGLPMVLRKLA